MPLTETEYCIEQITVPPKLPMILKQFCKCAIRTQPYDLLKWSSAYFHALANGEEPPTKLRIEFPPASSAHGLTLGFVKVLLRQLGAYYNKNVCLDTILKRWRNLCLDSRDFDMIVRIGKFRNHCQLKKFFAIAVGLLTCTLTETMINICKLFTFEPDGGSAMISVGLFMDIYGYLGNLRCDGAEKEDQELCLCAFQKTHSAQTIPEAKIETESQPEIEPLPETESKTEADLTISESHQSHVRDPDAKSVTIAPTSVGQETDVDMDLEYESYSKEDIQSGSTMQSFGEEMSESYLHEGEASFQSSFHTTESMMTKSVEFVEPTLKSVKSLKFEESEKAAQSVMSIEETEMNKEVGAEESISYVSKEFTEKTSYASSQEPCESCDSFPNYPCIPGIGRKLLAEEIATVAIWMAECARRQEGLVGPRNIRHINCPPLSGTCHASPSSTSSCTDT